MAKSNTPTNADPLKTWQTEAERFNALLGGQFDTEQLLQKIPKGDNPAEAAALYSQWQRLGFSPTAGEFAFGAMDRDPDSPLPFGCAPFGRPSAEFKQLLHSLRSVLGVLHYNLQNALSEALFGSPDVAPDLLSTFNLPWHLGSPLDPTTPVFLSRSALPPGHFLTERLAEDLLFWGGADRGPCFVLQERAVILRRDPATGLDIGGPLALLPVSRVLGLTVAWSEPRRRDKQREAERFAADLRAEKEFASKETTTVVKQLQGRVAELEKQLTTKPK